MKVFYSSVDHTWSFRLQSHYFSGSTIGGMIRYALIDRLESVDQDIYDIHDFTVSTGLN